MNSCDPHKRFAAALLLRAVKDAGNVRADQSERAEAVAWLTESRDAADFLDALNLHPDKVTAWTGTLWQEKTV